MNRQIETKQLSELLVYVIKARDKFIAGIRDYPPISTERWSLYHEFLPACSQVGDSLFDKAIAEAHQSGDLATHLPRIETLQKALEKYCRAAIECKQGNNGLMYITSEVNDLNNAINALTPLTSEPKGTKSKQNDVPKVNPITDNHTQEEWSKPMPKTEMATRLGLNQKAFNTFIKTSPVTKLGRQQWQIRLDEMDSNTRHLIEHGRPKKQ